MTGRDAVAAALRKIGVLAAGESVPAQEAEDALDDLNRMIGSWSNEGLMIYESPRESFTLTPGVGSYTIGDGATFDTVRPTYLDAATIENQSATPKIELQLNIIRSAIEWSTVMAKSLTSTIPENIYYDRGYPNDTIYLYPIPSVANKLVIYTKKKLSAITDMNSEIVLPPGYDDAIVYNLALRLAPEYGKQVSEYVMMVAIESKALIKRVNHETAIAIPDSIPSGGGGAYNILTGGTS